MDQEKEENMDQARDRLQETRKRANKTLAGCIINVTTVLSVYVTLSLYIPALAEKFGASVTAVVLLFTFASIASLVSNFVLAGLLDRIKIRVLIVIGDICFLSFLTCMILGSNITVLYIGAVLFGLSVNLIGFTTAQPLVTWWHTENVGKKISFLSIGYGAFAVVLSTAASFLLSRLGLEKTILIQLVFFGALLVISVAFFISEKPSVYGLMPYGYKVTEIDASADAPSAAIVGAPFKKCLSSLPFWGIFVVLFILNGVANSFVSNASIFLQSCGLDAVKAGVFYSGYNAVLLVWVFLFGYLCDKKGVEIAVKTYVIIAIVAYGLSATGLIQGIGLAVLSVVGFGTPGSCVSLIGAVAYQKLYGTRSIGALISFANVAQGLGSFLAPLATASYSNSGSWNTFLTAAVVLIVIALVLYVFSSSKKSVEKANSLFI